MAGQNKTCNGKVVRAERSAYGSGGTYGHVLFALADFPGKLFMHTAAIYSNGNMGLLWRGDPIIVEYNTAGNDELTVVSLKIDRAALAKASNIDWNDFKSPNAGSAA